VPVCNRELCTCASSAVQNIDADVEFPGESTAASKMHVLHALATAAMVCANATAKLWDSPRVGSDGAPLVQLAVQQLAGQLLTENLAMNRVAGVPPSLQQFGLSMHMAEDAVPALYNHYRCALLERSLACLRHARPSRAERNRAGLLADTSAAAPVMRWDSAVPQAF
jgi:hypothetical protein